MALMKELKGIGAHNVTINRNRGFSTSTHLKNLISGYDVFRKNGYLPATFDVIYISGRNGL
jgi:malonyl-CoA O-methyltransferase